MKKGQATIELIATIGLVMLIFIVVAVSALQKNMESEYIKMFLDAQRIAGSVADNINAISEQGPGYYRYFSVPAWIYGDVGYNVTCYNNFVEISWGNYTWSTQIVTSNARVYCLDRGLNVSNRVFNRNNSIEVTCHRPNLRVVDGSFKPVSVEGGENTTFSFDVEDDSHVASGVFIAEVVGVGNISVGGLAAGEEKEVVFTAALSSGTHLIRIIIDSGNIINESIESDNYYNATVVAN